MILTHAHFDHCGMLPRLTAEGYSNFIYSTPVPEFEAYNKNLNWTFKASQVDSVILTHAHFDHCGMLPRLTAEGYSNFIYSTPATRDLAKIVMLDSAQSKRVIMTL